MREIKFRAWKKDYEYMMYNIQNAYDGLSGAEITDSTGSNISYDESCFGDFLNNPDYEIMQFTGIRDKNGVDVYEGDIVRVSADGQSYVSVVLGPDGDYPAFDLDMKYIPDTWYYEANVLSTIASGEFEEMVVIGNVHESQKLLEASK